LRGAEPVAEILKVTFAPGFTVMLPGDIVITTGTGVATTTSLLAAE